MPQKPLSERKTGRAAESKSPGSSQVIPNLRQDAFLGDVHRTLPHSADAEQGVLGSILISSEAALSKCISRITDKHFHLPAHAEIYRTLLELVDSRPGSIDFITLTQHLKDQSKLDLVGGPAFVTHLFTFVPTAANLDYYIEILQEKFILRQIIEGCTECVSRAYNDQDEVQNLLDEVQQKIFSISEDRTRKAVPLIKDQVMDAVEGIEKIFMSKGEPSGLTTGLKNLDTMTDGLHGAEMIVIAARPSMGKTALAMNIAEYVAADLGKSVAVFSLEMSAQQLIQRMICSHARISLKKIKDGFLSERDFPRIMNSAQRFSDSKMVIDDTAGLSILELRSKARRLKAEFDVQLIVIDYLQLLKSTSRRGQENRQIEISEISSGIKALAKDLNIPIIVLAQLNRGPENRTGESKGRPRLSDLRESGSIEQDADVVGLLVREEYYANSDDEKEATQGKATLIIAKQRNGPTGDVPLTFLKEFTRFEDRAPDYNAEE